MLPETYRHWQSAARRLLEPLAGLMQPGRASLEIQGAPSDHDRQADRVESFARPLTLAAFYLQSAPEDDASASTARAFRAQLSRWFREGIVAGTDPQSREY